MTKSWEKPLTLRICSARLSRRCIVQVGRRLVKKGHVDVRYLAQQRQAHGQGGGHLLAAGELLEGPLSPAGRQQDLVILGPLQPGAVIGHDVGVETGCLQRDDLDQGLGHLGAGIAQHAAQVL